MRSLTTYNDIVVCTLTRKNVWWVVVAPALSFNNGMWYKLQAFLDDPSRLIVKKC